ncbi:hybrid sensor histidine kinase/response regulator [Azospirillum sp. BE72]|uniref:ATP-binding response regulator n=1 Tax=Azospirillum sp. BE72 TaxID=2817776 RepID=UPI002861BDB1|nr:hybrid sensor histidine kinase/response regulator [Azospirillum sp. BE72]MDR6772475.1 signal transduction histidine kinase/ActR/RegA family two-component response regulator [Azospirillum sp. BE72]
MAISLKPFHGTSIPKDTDAKDTDAMPRSSANPMSPTDQRYRECLDNARRVCAAGTVPTMLVIGGPEMAAVRCNEPLAALLNRPRAATRDESGPSLLPGGWTAVADALRPLYVDEGDPTAAGRPESSLLNLPTNPPLSLRAAPLLVDGHVVGVLASATLDGAIAQMAETMRAEVARTTAARSRFLASASHDLRQPFQAMRLFLDALTSQVDGNARATRTAGMLANAMTAGEQLLNALLDISTLDAGTVEPDLQPVSVDGLLQSLAEEFRPQAEEKGLRLRVHVPDVAGGAVTRSDPILLSRIVRNLLANAIRYTQRGGILLGLRKRDGQWRIEVWDTGFGIPQDKLDVIFDEFHQLTNPSRDPTRGLGLGLAIVRRLSVLLQAPIEVQSRSGRGSVFAVTVNRLEGEAPADTPTVGGHVDGGPSGVPLDGMRILVVDDDSMVLSGLLLTLESWGCTFVSASNMREVFAAVDGLEGPPDAILTDLRLPGKVSGFDVIDRVRKLFKADIPAVVLTGETAPESLLEGQRRGCAFLHKPLHPGELRRVLEEVRRDGKTAC